MTSGFTYVGVYVCMCVFDVLFVLVIYIFMYIKYMIL